MVMPPRGRVDLEELHCGHPGVSKKTAFSRNYVWWPKCDAHIEEMVYKCAACQQQ